MPDYLDIDYARPLDNSERPFDTYLNNYYKARNQKLNEQYTEATQANANARAADASQRSQQSQLASLSKLSALNLPGIWNKQQAEDIDALRNQVKAKIMAGDPSYATDLADGTARLTTQEKNADGYYKWVDQEVANLSKNKAINPQAARDFIINKTAMGPDGQPVRLSDFDINSLQGFNPLLAPGSSAMINRDQLAHDIVSMFPVNTQTFDNTNRANGITNQTNKTISSTAFTRVNPRTGQVSLNTELVSKSPELMNTYFDPYRSSNGDVYLIKPDIYQDVIRKKPELLALVADEIQKANAGKKPGDSGYIEPNSEDGDLVGRAVLTQLLTGMEHGNFKLKTTYGQNQTAGSGGGKPPKAEPAADLLQRFKGAMDQDVKYMRNNETSSTPLARYLGLNPNDIVDLTPKFKDFNVGGDDRGRGVPAEHIFVRKDDPGAVYVDYGDGTRDRLTAKTLPTWLDKKAQFNKKLDAVKLDDEYRKIFGTQDAEPFITSNVPDQKRSVAQRVKDTIVNTVKSIGGKKDTVKPMTEAEMNQYR